MGRLSHLHCQIALDCPIALLPYCPIALLPYCPIALLPYCPIAFVRVTSVKFAKPLSVREEPWNDKCCSNGFCPNRFSTPPPPSNRTRWGYFFSRKLVNFFKSAVLTMGIDIFKMTMVKT